MKQNFYKVNQHFFILTGGPGVGKTSVIKALKEHNFSYVQEVARKIIKDQISKNGDALPWKNKERYKKLMLEKSISDYNRIELQPKKIYFFDRGLPDTLAYAKLENLKIDKKLYRFCNNYRYNKTVFIFPPWKEIYKKDSERKQTFDEVVQTNKMMTKTYQECDYNLLVVPKTTIDKRVEFILKKIEALN